MQSQPRRPRAAKPVKRLKKTLSIVAPTTNQVERALRSINMNSRRQGSGKTDPWVMCRLQPDRSMGGTQKPDGVGSCRSISVDHLVADTLTCITGAGFTIQTFPGMLPFTGIITGNGSAGTHDISVNSVSYLNAATTPTNPQSWAPLGILTEWASNYAGLQNWTPSSTPRNDPYTSARARVLAVKRRLIYTGTLTNNAGFVTVTPSPYCLSTQQGRVSSTSTSAVANEIGFALKDYAQTTTTGALLDTPFYTLDVESGTNPLFNKDTVMYRVEQGVEILSKQSGSIHQFVPIPDSSYYVVANASTIPATGGSIYAPVNCDMVLNGTSQSGVVINDDTWCGELINVTGVTAGATFRLETILCVEYELQSASALAPMAMKPPAPRPAAVAQAQAMVNRLPVAVPGGQVAFINKKQAM